MAICNSNFWASMAKEEGEVGIDCKALKPELVVNAGAKVYVSCNFQQSDEADSTRFEISWDSNGEPVDFIKNIKTSLEVKRMKMRRILIPSLLGMIRA